MLRIALAGNPNVGKTTFFNSLARTRHHVGNWPGKTVERLSAIISLDGRKAEIVDLPGAYGLEGHTEDEAIARDFILKEKPDAIINIIDSGNLERNLLLTEQLIRTRTPVIVAANFDDALIDDKKLALMLSVPVMRIDCRSRSDVLEVARKALDAEGAIPKHNLNPSQIARACVIKERQDRFGWIDRLVLLKVYGPLSFVVVMALLFQISFTLSSPISDLLESAFSGLASLASSIMLSLGAQGWAASLAEASVGGVGSVLVFVPVIFMLYLSISVLEDSGYMARVSFVFDSYMHRLGLHGKSMISLLLGFGCTVSSIASTRSLGSRKEKLLTMLMSPFISCSARLPVIALMAGAFFSQDRGLVFFLLYSMGILSAIITGLILNRFLFRGEESALLIEMPPYRSPSIPAALASSWSRTMSFITKAGTLIFAASVVIWFLANLPLGVEYASEESIAGRIGHVLAPLLAPLGFGTWEAAVALLFGLAAKEIVVSTLGSIYGADMSVSLQASFSQASAFSFLVFVVLYTPCLSTLAAMYKETGSLRWPAFTLVYSLIVAWSVSFLAYRLWVIFG